MKRLLIICGMLLLSGFPALGADTGYSAVIEDLPLMPGMVEKADDAVVFDKPGGRILETTAEIAATPDAVRKFYADTLPPLGWKPASALGFIREDEILKLGIEQKKQAVIVHFNLAPLSTGK